MNKDELKNLKKIAKDSAEQIDESAFFLSLFTPNYEKDPVALMQLALGILLEKPLLLVVPHGVKIPPRLEQIADGIARYDPEDMTSAEEAVKEILKNAMRH